MDEFSVILNDRDPQMLRTVLNINYSPYLGTAAKFMHALMSRQFGLIAKLKAEDQHTQYMASVQHIGSLRILEETLSLYEGENNDHWSLFIAATNKTKPKDMVAAGETEKSYDFNWTAVSITNALMGTKDYDVCTPMYRREICTLMLAVVEALKDTHHFNVYVHEGSNLMLKAISHVDDTVVIFKTRSWSELASLRHTPRADETPEDRPKLVVH